MTSTASRTTSAPRARLHLQPRDVELLRAVLTHQAIRSDHLHTLICPTVSRRVVQGRLKLLFAHGLVQRLFLPIVLDGIRPTAVPGRQPIYTLTTRGARLLSEVAALPSEIPPRWRTELPSPYGLAHHLVVTDFLVALAGACHQRADVELVSATHEAALWRQLREYRRRNHGLTAIVPDGTVTLRAPPQGEPLTFYLEVVRADVRGGNRRLTEKLARYSELLRAGFFRDAYGHRRIRAVLFATTSPIRAENLRRLAEQLPYGRRLFWFGTYQAKGTEGRIERRFDAERILALSWHDAEARPLSIEQALIDHGLPTANSYDG